VGGGAARALAQLVQQSAGADHVHEESGHRLAGQAPGAGRDDLGCAGVEGDLLALAQRFCLGAGQQQQAHVEGVAKVQPAVRRRNDGRHAQVHQHGGSLLARGADAEVGPGHQHVAGLHARGEVGADGLQAVPGDDVDAVLHRMARREQVGVDVGAQAPDAVRCLGHAHASTSRGSVTCPRNAAAATV
jgi:hypothetical protein